MNVVHFSFNNWFSGRDYPIGEKYSKLVCENYFSREDWVKENKLVVVTGPIDMSKNWCVSAPKQWVEENLPELLTDNTYTYKINQYYKGEEKEITYIKNYSDFVCIPNKYGDIISKYGMPFKEYLEENIGVHWWNEYEGFIDGNFKQ